MRRRGIELLFKLWKIDGKLDEWWSYKPWRILIEVYAKLVAMLLPHWVLVVCCWQYPNRSLTKAAQTVRGWGLYLARALHSTRALTAALIDIHRCLQTGCRIKKRRARPHAHTPTNSCSPYRLSLIPMGPSDGCPTALGTKVEPGRGRSPCLPAGRSPPLADSEDQSFCPLL